MTIFASVMMAKVLVAFVDTDPVYFKTHREHANALCEIMEECGLLQP
jgi:hypothetical protein